MAHASPDTRRRLVLEWRTRLIDLLIEFPQATSELQTLLEQEQATSSTTQHSWQQHVSGGDHSSVYGAQGNQDIREYHGFSGTTIGGTYAPGDHTVVGPVIGGKVSDNRGKYRIRIGKVNLSIGNFVAIVVAMLLLSGGAVGGVILATQGPSVSLTQAVGTWRYEGGNSADGSVGIDNVILKITQDGKYDSTLTGHLSPDNQNVRAIVWCKGVITIDNDHFVFHRQASGSQNLPGAYCEDFAAKPAADGRSLDLYYTDFTAPFRFERVADTPSPDRS
jgi:hypothetical protein